MIKAWSDFLMPPPPCCVMLGGGVSTQSTHFVSSSLKLAQCLTASVISSPVSLPHRHHTSRRRHPAPSPPAEHLRSAVSVYTETCRQLSRQRPAQNPANSAALTCLHTWLAFQPINDRGTEGKRVETGEQAVSRRAAKQLVEPITPHFQLMWEFCISHFLESLSAEKASVLPTLARCLFTTCWIIHERVA